MLKPLLPTQYARIARNPHDGWRKLSSFFAGPRSSSLGSLLVFNAGRSIGACSPPFASIGGQVRSKSGISNFNFWAKDVLRTWKINPPNPILQGSGSGNSVERYGWFSPPDFEHMLPYHLEKATKPVIQQYMIDIAEWELSLTGPPSERQQDASTEVLYRIEAPVMQLLEVGRLFTELASPPDQLKQWEEAYSKLQSAVHKAPWRDSKIIYRALLEEKDQCLPAECSLDFQLSGANLDDDDEREELQEIQGELQLLMERFAQNDEHYNLAPKAVRLQMVSDLYNWIGLSNLQAQKLGYTNIFEMYAQCYDHEIAQPNDVGKVCKEVSSFLKGYLPKVEVTLNQDVGGFLATKEETRSEEEKEVLKSRFFFRKSMRLHGVLQGIADFCESIFGIRVELDSGGKGWNPKVRALRLYDSDTNNQLGTVYLDAFQDTYWRSENAENLVTSHLFTGRRAYSHPISVVVLRIPPAWDDSPIPLSWDDTLQLLFHFGNALQMILSQIDNDTGMTVPTDGATLLASFMEMWILNDGFVQRLVQLSEDGGILEQEFIDTLRDDLKKKKALELMNNVFLGSLELEIFTGFDPRGDETLSALQARYASEYAPHDIPESSDLSPLFEVLHGNAVENGKIRAYDQTLSSVLAAMIYEKFKNTDLRHQDEVKQLGRGIRDLFRRKGQGTVKDVAELCGKSTVSAEDLRRVYGF